MTNRWENSGNGGRHFSEGSKITEDSDYSHEIKRCLLLLDSIKQDQRLTGSDHEICIAKFRLKLKNVGKTARAFRNDLYQFPEDYTV